MYVPPLHVNEHTAFLRCAPLLKTPTFFCILWMVAQLTSPVFLCVLCSHNVVLLRCNHLLPLNLLNKVNGTQLNMRNCKSWVVSPSSKYSKAPWSLSREYFEEQKLTEVASTWLAHRSARRDISSALCEWKLLPISTRVIFVRIPGICTLHIVQDINICTFHQVHIIMIRFAQDMWKYQLLFDKQKTFAHVHKGHIVTLPQILRYVQNMSSSFWQAKTFAHPEILKVVSAVNTLVLFFCPCCANFFWSVYAAGKDETAGIGIF